MEKFLNYHKKENVSDIRKVSEKRKHKTRKYDTSYLSLGFTSILIDDCEKPMCLVCMKVLAADSMRPAKLRRHFETMHSQYSGKPYDFFKRKLDEFNTQKRNLKETVSVPSKALLASYEVAYRIAKCKKAYTIGETLILPAAIDMVKIMFGETYSNQLRQIPLSDNTIGRRIDDISDDLCEQLVSRLRISNFAIQVDEAIDIANDAHLIAYVRYVMDDNIAEDILFCNPIPGKSISDEIFNIIDTFLNKNNIDWNNCVGLCTDGAKSMSGHKAGLQALVRKKSPDIIWTHCMLHRAALASKEMNEELHAIFTEVTKVINYIKNSPLRIRLFGKLCEDMDANYTSLLYHCEVRWLSGARAIQRVFELKEEIALFLEENHYARSNLFRNENFIVKLAYLVDIFGKLSVLNKSMQGPQMHSLIQKDKVNAFIKKLNLWKSNLKKNQFDMFPYLIDFQTAVCINANINVFIEHMDGLIMMFSHYFKDLDFSRLKWIKNPFILEEDDEFGLTTDEQEKLIDLSCDSLLQQKFQREFLVQFWLNISEEYKILSKTAIKVLLPFVTTYLCETGFSAIAVMKYKHRSRLVVENDLRVALSSMKPRFDKLCANKQPHPSH